MADAKTPPTKLEGATNDALTRANAELSQQVKTFTDKFEGAKKLHKDLFDILDDHAITPGAAMPRVRQRLAQFKAEFMDK